MEKLGKSTATLEGVVTNVCGELAMFEVDNKTQVFSAKLPEINAKVRLVFKHYASSKAQVECIVLTKRCKLDTSGNLEAGAPLLNIPIDKQLKLGQMYNYLKNLGHKRHISLESILKALIKIDDVPDRLQMINSFRYIDCVRPEMYTDLTEWNFGIHNSYSNTLLTYFYVNPKYGTFYCSDFKKTLPCVVTNSKNLFLPDFVNKMVLVRSYKVITEIYAGRNPFYGTEAVLFDLDDVVALEIWDGLMKGCKQYLFRNFDYCSDCFDGGDRLVVLSRSVPTCLKDGTIQSFLEVCLLNDNGRAGDPIVYMLNSSCTALLQVGCVYNYYYVDSSCISETKCEELNYLACAKIEKVDGDFVFVLSSEMTIDQAAAVQAKKEKMKQFREVLEGVLVTKNFANVPGMSSWKKIKCPKFGCPASDRTCILTVRSNSGQESTLYMNNWENMTTPVCLIPNIRLIIRDVVKNDSGNSYRCTPMTSFEILGYEPKVTFETASLFDDNNWGRSSYMGAPGIPNGAILWDQPSIFFILGLKIKILPNNQLDAVITLVATDPMGEYKVIAKHGGGISLFRLLLNLEEPLFKPIHDAMRQYKCEFDLGSSFYPRDMDPTVVALKKQLSTYFTAVNSFGLRLDLKCRKIDEEKRNAKPVYYLLDARMKARL